MSQWYAMATSAQNTHFLRQLQTGHGICVEHVCHVNVCDAWKKQLPLPNNDIIVDVKHLTCVMYRRWKSHRGVLMTLLLMQ